MVSDMKCFKGQTASAGIAVGVIREYRKRPEGREQGAAVDTEQEKLRLARAIRQADSELQLLQEKTANEVGAKEAAIFEAHRMLLMDAGFTAAMEDKIASEHRSAQSAAAETGEAYAGLFEGMEDAYMKERAADIRDIADRLIQILNGEGDETEALEENTILVADDLSPSQTIMLDKSKIAAFVTRKGSVNSHTAILAKSLNLPALVQVEIPEGWDGRPAIVDGDAGELILEPDEETVLRLNGRRQAVKKQQEQLLEYRSRETVTKAGKKVMLYANVGEISDIRDAAAGGAEGIGLFRSEFLYLAQKDYPSEEKQFQIYRQAVEQMGEKRVIIRTLDMGADKQIDYFHLEPEENPALGCRGIRASFARMDVFRTQLRALCRASAFGRLAVMFPMITSLWEVRKAKQLVRRVQEELAGEGISCCENMELGIMIETPAAVMIAEELAKEVDFFSIGTNDLFQYTLAVDRQNQKLAPFYDACHPAILKMIRITVEEAHKAGIWAGICGELAADLKMTEEFVRLGVDELSVSPEQILPVRKKICEME